MIGTVPPMRVGKFELFLIKRKIWLVEIAGFECVAELKCLKYSPQYTVEDEEEWQIRVNEDGEEIIANGEKLHEVLQTARDVLTRRRASVKLSGERR